MNVEENVTEVTKASKKDKKKTAQVLGAVFYCDGGVRPTNPGPAAFGIHGYFMDTSVPLKGIGFGSTVTTSKGYELKADCTDIESLDVDGILKKNRLGDFFQAMPTEYVDITGVAGLLQTNNYTELRAVLRALEYFEERLNACLPGQEYRFVNIRTDSDYAVKGFDKMHVWAPRRWIRPDGSLLANPDMWQKIYEAQQRLMERGVDISLEWIRGHDGDIGNERADMLATMGVFYAITKRDETFENIMKSEVDTYWKIDNERHPFIANRHIYFNTLKDSCEPGIYFLGSHGKDDELLGQRMSDAANSVIRLDQADDTIEKIRELQAGYSNHADRLYAANLTNLFDRDVTHFANNYGSLGIRPQSDYRLSLSFLDRINLTHEFNPALISIRAVQTLEVLNSKLDEFLAGSDEVKSTNITDVLYETTSKTSKSGEVTFETKLRAEIQVGLEVIEVSIVNPIDSSRSPYKLKLTLGLDILTRNSLKRAEVLNPKVHVITWIEGDNAFRFATVIKANGCVGIWAGYDSSLRLLA